MSVRGHGAASTGQREVGLDRPCHGNTLTNEGFSTPSSPPRSEAAGACWAPSPTAFVPDLHKVSANGDVTAAFGVPLTQPHTPGAPDTLVPLQSCECCCPVGASPAPGALLHPNASGTDVCCPPLATLSGHGCPLCCLGGDITHTPLGRGQQLLAVRTAGSRGLQLGWLHRGRLRQENVENKDRGCAAPTRQHAVRGAPSPRAAPTSAGRRGTCGRDYFTREKAHPSPKLPQNHSGRAGNRGKSPLGAALMGQSPLAPRARQGAGVRTQPQPCGKEPHPAAFPMFLRRIQAAALPGGYF